MDQKLTKTVFFQKFLFISKFAKTLEARKSIFFSPKRYFFVLLKNMDDFLSFAITTVKIVDFTITVGNCYVSGKYSQYCDFWPKFEKIDKNRNNCERRIFFMRKLYKIGSKPFLDLVERSFISTEKFTFFGILTFWGDVKNSGWTKSDKIGIIRFTCWLQLKRFFPKVKKKKNIFFVRKPLIRPEPVILRHIRPHNSQKRILCEFMKNSIKS